MKCPCLLDVSLLSLAGIFCHSSMSVRWLLENCAFIHFLKISDRSGTLENSDEHLLKVVLKKRLAH